jgi:hypothetical protein
VGRARGERVWTERCLGPEHPLTLALSAANRTREEFALVAAVAINHWRLVGRFPGGGGDAEAVESVSLT